MKRLDGLEAQIRAIGLTPRAASGYRRNVPLVEPTASARLSLGVTRRRIVTIFRSDSYMPAKYRVPALFIKSGTESRLHARGSIKASCADDEANRCPKPGDEYHADWDVAGNLEDRRLLYAVGAGVTDRGVWPACYEISEFRSICERSPCEASR